MASQQWVNGFDLSRDSELQMQAEVEMIPLVALCLGEGAKAARKVQLHWLMRRESQDMYRAVQSARAGEEQNALQTYLTDPYFLKVLQSGETFNALSAVEKIREMAQWRRVKNLMMLLGATTDKKTMRGLCLQMSQALIEEGETVYVSDPENPAPPTRFLLETGGQEFTPCGDITSVKAKAKNGKTQLCAILAAAMIAADGREVCGVRRVCADVGEDGVPVVSKPLKVLYIDTEQSWCSSDKLLAKVLFMAGYDTRRRCEHIKMVNLRMMKKDERMPFIEAEVSDGKYDAVLLDGIKDLAKDFNDNLEADALMDRILSMIQDTGVNLTAVLHENPGKDNDKMRGHLGTEMCNKSFEVLQTENDKAAGVFNVVNTDRREKTIPTFAFGFDDEGMLVGMTPTVSSESGPQSESHNRPTKAERDWNVFVKAFEENIDLSLTQKEIIDALLKKSTLSRSTIQNRIAKYTSEKRILTDGSTELKNTRYWLSSEEKIKLRGDILDINDERMIDAGKNFSEEGNPPF